MLLIRKKLYEHRTYIANNKDRMRYAELVARGLPVGSGAVMDHDQDELDDDPRVALHTALAQAKEDIDQGRLVDGDEILDRLRARHG